MLMYCDQWYRKQPTSQAASELSLTGTYRSSSGLFWADYAFMPLLPAPS